MKNEKAKTGSRALDMILAEVAEIEARGEDASKPTGVIFLNRNVQYHCPGCPHYSK